MKGDAKTRTDNTILISQTEYNRLLSQEQRVTELELTLKQFQRMIFGRKSERHTPESDPNQLSLFAEENPSTPTTDAQKETITYERKKSKKKPVRTPLPDNLPRVDELIEPDILPDGAFKIGEEITEILEYTPANFYVRRIIRPKYAVRHQEEAGVSIAELPSLPIPKGNAGASLLAHVMVSKYVDHLPFYRQRQMYKRQGVSLSESTINGWFNAVAKLLTPLYDTLECEVLACDYLQADESPIGVQSSHKKGALHKGYQWVYRSPEKGLVLFKYDKGRSHEAPQAILNNFNGALQTDGYKAYQIMQTEGEITLLACMTHARRYFEKALDNDKARAEYVLNLMKLLFLIERKAKEKNVSLETKQRYRQRYATPILDELENWLSNNATQVLPKSAIGKAIAYTTNLWERLRRYTEDARYEIDNNLIENSIRPLALGRKNYLFAGSHNAAQYAAMCYSFFASCKTMGINPTEWLTDVLNRIQDHKVNKLSLLLPQNWKKQS